MTLHLCSFCGCLDVPESPCDCAPAGITDLAPLVRKPASWPPDSPRWPADVLVPMRPVPLR